jgi:O-antigen/teichoic acid export membrane protein
MLDPGFEVVNLHAPEVEGGAEDSQVTGPTPKETETVTGVWTSLFGRAFLERFEQKQEKEAGDNGRKGMPAIDGTRVWGNLIPWAMKGGLALLDQGLMTGSNFVMGIILARWLPPEQYGAYAVAFAVFLLVLMLYQSLFLEPQAVFGASAYQGCFRGYVKVLLRLHLATALLIFCTLGVSAEVALKQGQPGRLPGALAGVALAAPCILLLWLARRTSYLEFSPAPAAAGSVFYCVLTLGGLYMAYRFHLLSPMSAFLLMGLGALGASVFLLTYLKLRLPRTQGAPTLRDTWRCHWSYGRWALASAALMWVPWNIFYPLLSSLSGMAQAGELKALMNFTAPVLQAYTAFSSLLLPYLVRIHEREGYSGTSAVTRRVTLLCVSGAVAYWAPLLLLKGPVFRLVYSARYSEVAYLLPVVALGSVSWSAFFGLANALRAMTSPASVFAAVLVSSCVSVTIGVPAAWALGVKGAVWSMALSETLSLVMALVLLRRKMRRASDAVPAVPELSVSS